MTNHAPDQPHPKVMCYSSKRQLQYYTVLSKPSTPSVPSDSKGKRAKGAKKESPPDMKWTMPKFYNVRPVAMVDETQPQAEIDEEVTCTNICVHVHVQCAVVLHCVVYCV